MNTVDFITAVSSGKRFKVVETSETVSQDYADSFLKFLDVLGLIEELNEYGSSVTTKIINSQFELEEKSITITESEFDKSFAQANVGLSFSEEVLKIFRNRQKLVLGF